MSLGLYRLAGFITKRAKATLLTWLLVILVAGGLAWQFGGSFQESFEIPQAESQAGIDVLSQRFPEVAGVSAQAVIETSDGSKLQDHQADVDRVIADFADLEHVTQVMNPLGDESLGEFSTQMLNDDGTIGIAQLQFDFALGEQPDDYVDQLLALVDQAEADTDLQIMLGGEVFQETSVHVGVTEIIGVVVALIILVLTLGSFVAAGMPILTAIAGVGLTMTLIILLTRFVDVSSTAPTLALMIGLAVGIDYALFIVHRHRAQLAEGMEVRESIARALGTSGSAVIFAGATVIIALAGLFVAGLPFLTIMGITGAISVFIAVLIAITTIPALLALAGERLRPKVKTPKSGRRKSRREKAEHAETSRSESSRTQTSGTNVSQHRIASAWVGLVTRFRIPTVILVLTGIGLLAWPTQDLRLALPDNGSAPAGSVERITYDLIAEEFGPGYNSPLLVTTDIINNLDPLTTMQDLGDEIAKIPGVAEVSMAVPNESIDTGIVAIIPETSQTDPATTELVEHMRELAPKWEEDFDITDIKVTGFSAVAIDISSQLGEALLPFGIVVVGLCLILLTMVFRSIAVPIKAALGYLLSIGAAFGATTLVFEYGWFASALNIQSLGPVLSFLPIILMGVLFGLAMDYELFLVSRMREEYTHGVPAQKAIRSGFVKSSQVVVAAASIMIAVFGFFIPEATPMVQPIAFALAVGVFVDAFIVRMTLVPAVMSLLGDKAWWLPKWLAKILPVLDVEGETLERQLQYDQWQAQHPDVYAKAEKLRMRTKQWKPAEPDHTELSFEIYRGQVNYLHIEDPVVRRGVLAALGGRLEAQADLLAVGSHLLPASRSRVLTNTSFLAPSSEAEFVLLDSNTEQLHRQLELQGAAGATQVQTVVFASAQTAGQASAVVSSTTEDSMSLSTPRSQA